MPAQSCPGQAALEAGTRERRVRGANGVADRRLRRGGGRAGGEAGVRGFLVELEVEPEEQEQGRPAPDGAELPAHTASQAPAALRQLDGRKLHPFSSHDGVILPVNAANRLHFRPEAGGAAVVPMRSEVCWRWFWLW